MYRDEEKLCLKWNDFQENAISAFGTLREDREFADVTLACEDGQQVEAHKVILASSSPFFLNILRRNKHSHPLIYMRGLKSEDLLTMIDFVYFGEANVCQENLDSFLAVAEELQVKGLMRSDDEKENVENNHNTPQPKKKHGKQKHTEMDSKPKVDSLDKTLDSIKNEPQQVQTLVVHNNEDLNDKINSAITFSENHAGGTQGKARICKLCGKEGTLSHIISHIEGNHIRGVTQICTCGKTFRTRSALKKHKSKARKECESHK